MIALIDTGAEVPDPGWFLAAEPSSDQFPAAAPGGWSARFTVVEIGIGVRFTLCGVRFRRLMVMSLLVPIMLGVVGCSAMGGGATKRCRLVSCVVTFNRPGATASTSSTSEGDVKLVAVQGNTVVLSVGGQKLSVPDGQSRSTSEVRVTVQKIDGKKVIVRVSDILSHGR